MGFIKGIIKTVVNTTMLPLTIPVDIVKIAITDDDSSTETGKALKNIEKGLVEITDAMCGLD